MRLFQQPIELLNSILILWVFLGIPLDLLFINLSPHVDRCWIIVAVNIGKQSINLIEIKLVLRRWLLRYFADNDGDKAWTPRFEGDWVDKFVGDLELCCLRFLEIYFVESC